VIIWHLLTGNQPYSDLGAGYLLERHRSEASKNRLIRQLERMRYKLTLEPLNPPDQTHHRPSRLTADFHLRHIRRMRSSSKSERRPGSSAGEV
jgi:hypothetical protein